MAERELLVRIVGDDRDLQRTLGNTQRSVERIDSRTAAFGKNITRAFAAAGIGIGTAAIFSGIEKSVGAASDLNEQISRTKVIFGDASAATIAWSTTTARSMGISQRAALAAASTFAGLFQTVGVAKKDAGDFSQVLVKLAADLASLQNTTPEEALVALRSGLAGEAEPLRRFNIFLSEARVQQEALAESGKSTASALTQQEKTLARYNLILQDGAVANDNFKDTSDGLANQQRILAAQIDDLSTKAGGVLIPTLEGVVGALNDAAEAANNVRSGLDALGQIPPIDIVINFVFGGGRGAEIFQDIILGVISPGALGIKLGKQFAEGFSTGFKIPPLPPPDLGPRPDDKRDPRGAGEIARTNRVVADRQAKQAKADLAASRKRFGDFVKGLGLKLDRAGITESQADDLAVLREMERAILRQINTEGKTFKLVQQLVQVRAEIASVTAQVAADAKQKSQDAFDDTVDALTLDLNIAEATKSFADDQVALRAIENAILARIASEGKTTDLMRQLFQVRQQQADVARQLREQQQAQQKANQFKSLGLTEEGDKPTPGSGSLLRRAQSLRDQIKGTALDTPKTRSELTRIVNTLKANMKTAGRDVRQAIEEMLNDIANGFKSGSKDVDRSSGEITRGGIRSTQKLLKGLGLTPEQARELQRRNLGVSSGSHTSAFGFAVGGTGGSLADAGKGGNFVITGPITVVTNDPNDLMKKLQKVGRRGSGGRRGRHGGANLGLQ